MFKRDLRWFKKVLVVILCYLSNIKLQTAYVSSLGHLQIPGEDHMTSFMRRIRISRLKCCSLTSDSEKINFSGYLSPPYKDLKDLLNPFKRVIIDQ